MKKPLFICSISCPQTTRVSEIQLSTGLAKGWLWRVVAAWTGLMLSSVPALAIVAYEPFAAYQLDTTLSNPSQPSPPASTGMSSYTSENNFLTWNPRSGSLSLSMPFTTSGAKLHVSSGGVDMVGNLNLTGGNWNAYNGGSGAVGSVNGTTLYLSLLLQIRNPTDVSGNQCLVDFRETGTTRLSIGQIWGGSNFTVGSNLGIPLDSNVHLIVVRIDYLAGNDNVRVYWDPDPAGAEPVSATSTQSRLMSFNQIAYKAQRAGDAEGFYVDEIRFGATWEDVTPTPVVTYTLTASAGAHGTLYRSPTKTTFNPGETVYLEAISDWGHQFQQWTGDVPAGQTTTNPITLTMSQNRTVAAVFGPGVPGFFNFAPATDTYLTSAIDLRPLNESVAGVNGWVTRSGSVFKLGDGTPVRFWGATVSAIADPNLAAMARFLAKRGLNMVRWHTSLYNNNAANLSDVNMSAVNDLQRLVTRMKAEGIYTKASFFFILGLRIKASWAIDGYDATWIAANDDNPTTEPSHALEAPFALQFFDEKFKAAYKNWANVLFTTPNPYNNNIPLKDDPALAIIEIQNEDNLFFWTFDMNRFPNAQKQKIETLFGTWLAAKYGSIAAAQTAWGAVSGGLDLSRDNPGAGRMTLSSAWYMTSDWTGNTGGQRRISDQIQFLLALQHDWYAEMRDYLANTVGCHQLFTASNWKTADDTFLLDGEYYTYSAADIIDTHNYFSPLVGNQALFTQMSGGDDFFGIPVVNNPRTSPIAIKQVENHPSMISESTWTNPSNFKAEAALTVAAYGALNDLDSFFWFATGDPAWQSGVSTWEFATPLVAGMFPGAALLYRRGDVSQAPVVVREGRTLATIGNKQKSLVVETRGWDPTRDPDQEFDYDPISGQGQVDSLATLVGKVEVAFDGDTDYVHPNLSDYIDTTSKTVTSINGELQINWGQVKGANPPATTAGEGRFTVNTARAQAACGWLGEAGSVSLNNVDIDMHNEWGSVLVISLDGMPLSHSTKALIQAASSENTRRWETVPRVVASGGTNYQGEEIVNVGELPWQVEGIDGTVTLKNMGVVTAVQALDGNGYAIASLPVTSTIVLPSQALYTVVTLASSGMTYGGWSGFTAQEYGQPALSGKTANPDGDRFDNLTEYVFNLPPKTFDATLPIALSTATADLGQGPQQFVQLNFRIRTDDAQVTHAVEVSGNLAQWSANGGGPDVTEIVSSTVHGDGTTSFIVRDKSPLTPGGTRFIRLRWIAQ